MMPGMTHVEQVALDGGARLGRRAVVIGGSMAGLLAARALADHFAEVVVLERDRLEESASGRKGVPQGRHAHGLLVQGRMIVERFFPDLFVDLVERGATPVDMGADMRWYQFGHWKLRYPSGITVYSLSRSLLEWKVRTRLLARANVLLLDNCDVTGLRMDAAGGTVAGVSYRERGGNGAEASLEADLVVDAGGRGSRMPRWLAELGFPQVEETRVAIDVGYASRVYRRPAAADPGWKVLAIFPTPPRETRMGFMLPIEGDRWILSLAGWHGDHAPNDEAGFLEYVRGLPRPDLYHAIKHAEPLEPIAIHKMPHNQRRHYERMERFPQGLIVLGDALCSFNPIYGQGMTTAALEAVTLAECLREQQGRGLAGLGRRFQPAAARTIDVPWMLATAEDFRYPQTTGPRFAGLGLLHWYTARLHRVSAFDETVARQFLQVMNMLQPPAALFAPRIAGRVLFSPAGRAASPTAAPRSAHSPAAW